MFKFVVPALVLAALLSACGGSGKSNSEPTSVPTHVAEVSSTVVVATQAPTQIPTQAPPPTATVAIPTDNRIQIPSIGVDAPLSLKTVVKGEALPNPDGADDAAVYDFSQSYPESGGLPGAGNTVISGRPRTAKIPCKSGTVPPPCDAVFVDLSKVQIGDKVQVSWDQKAYSYSVSAVCSLPITGNFDPVVAKTTVERLTLFTVGGTLDQSTHTYSDYVIVVADREPGTNSGCPSGTKQGPPPTE
jgi:sortase (surface protein transpeptidase)